MQKGTSRNTTVDAMTPTQSRSRYSLSTAEIAAATSKGTAKMGAMSSIPAKFRRASREKDSVLPGCTSTVPLQVGAYRIEEADRVPQPLEAAKNRMGCRSASTEEAMQSSAIRWRDWLVGDQIVLDRRHEGLFVGRAERFDAMLTTCPIRGPHRLDHEEQVPRIDGSQDRLFEIGHQFRLSYLTKRSPFVALLRRARNINRKCPKNPDGFRSFRDVPLKFSQLKRTCLR